MTRSSSMCAASLLAFSLSTFGSASQAATQADVASANIVGAGAFEAVGALASRVLEPSLQSTGRGVTDATAPVPSAVPEPESIALLGLGLAALVVARRARKQR